MFCLTNGRKLRQHLVRVVWRAVAVSYAAVASNLWWTQTHAMTVAPQQHPFCADACDDAYAA
jgi:hypothetical protein